jgi:predicted phosphodiesterase
MGHTHQPDEVQLDGGMYYNPGSWTRYLELGSGDEVTLEDLKDEARYPYQLNYVRVESSGAAALKSKMVCFEQG